MGWKKASGGTRRPTRRNKNSAMAMAMDTVMLLPPLPGHLADDIFLQLTPKSVAASRCESSSWNSILSSAAFADRYHTARAAAGATSAPSSFPTLSTQEYDERVLAVWRQQDLP